VVDLFRYPNHQLEKTKKLTSLMKIKINPSNHSNNNLSNHRRTCSHLSLKKSSKNNWHHRRPLDRKKTVFHRLFLTKMARKFH